ncbi:hypothetical protein PWK10_10940 [Caloramator sp. Dgby_cultured_2]|nr:hypothetical protein [Caloramator sp. Dgby_cultured_2]WDU82222.1 hypothetical protein PWK10_10940 [Caloramator sp. Dgby_cultured_2]
MALDVPKEDDKVFEVEGVKIILDEEMVEYTPGFIIDYRNTYFGKRFSVESLYGGEDVVKIRAFCPYFFCRKIILF